MKIQGIAPQAPAAVKKAPGQVVDLMEILKQSLKETQNKGTRSLPQEEVVAVGPSRPGKNGRIKKAR